MACANCAVDVCCNICNLVELSCSLAISASSILLLVASVLVIAIERVDSFTVILEDQAPICCKASETNSMAVSTFARARAALDAEKTFVATLVMSTSNSAALKPVVVVP